MGEKGFSENISETVIHFLRDISMLLLLLSGDESAAIEQMKTTSIETKNIRVNQGCLQPHTLSLTFNCVVAHRLNTYLAIYLPPYFVCAKSLGKWSINIDVPDVFQMKSNYRIIYGMFMASTCHILDP